MGQYRQFPFLVKSCGSNNTIWPNKMILGREERKIHTIGKEGTSVNEKDIIFSQKVGYNPKIECDGMDQINHLKE